MEIIFILNNSLENFFTLSLSFLILAPSRIAYVEMPSAAKVPAIEVIEEEKLYLPNPVFPNTLETYG